MHSNVPGGLLWVRFILRFNLQLLKGYQNFKD